MAHDADQRLDRTGGGFETVRPLDRQRREAQAALKRWYDQLMSEHHVPTEAYREAGPRNPLYTPARVPPYERGERLEERNRAGPDNPLVGQRLMKLLDKLERQRRNRDERARSGPKRGRDPAAPGPRARRGSRAAGEARGA